MSNPPNKKPNLQNFKVSLTFQKLKSALERSS